MWLYYSLSAYITSLGLLLGTTGKPYKIKKKMFLILTLGLLTIMAALRAKTVGNDTSNYLYFFDNLSMGKDLSASRFEIGYVYLNKLLIFFTSQSQVLLIVSSIFTMYGFARIIYKYSTSPGLSVFLFFTLGYFGMTMNTIRQNIALVFILFAYDFLRERKLLKFVLLVVSATLFHRTALLFLIAYPVTKAKFNFKVILATVFGSVLGCILFPQLLRLLFNVFPMYQYYIGSDYLNGDVRLATVLNILAVLSIIIFGIYTGYHKPSVVYGVQGNSKVEGFINDGKIMLMLLVVGIWIEVISLNFNLLGRVSDYFLVFSILYFPNAIKCINNQKLRIFIIYLVAVLFFVYRTVIQLYRPEWNLIYPYKFFWQ